MKKSQLKRKNQSRLRKGLTWGLVLSLVGVFLAYAGHLSLLEHDYHPLESTAAQLSYENIGEGVLLVIARANPFL